MAHIKYIDEQGEHNGTLTIGEYVHYGINDRFPIDYPTGMIWDNTDYKPFMQAVNKKYNTTCTKAWLV